MGMKDRVVLEGKDPIEDFKKKNIWISVLFYKFLCNFIPTRSTSQSTENMKLRERGRLSEIESGGGKGVICAKAWGNLAIMPSFYDRQLVSKLSKINPIYHIGFLWPYY